MGKYDQYRDFLKLDFAKFKTITTDAKKGAPQPPKVKPYNINSKMVDLPIVDENTLTNKNIYTCIKEGRSTRFYNDRPISLNELSYLLWATQGIAGTNKAGLTLRMVPCSGATHSFESYLLIRNVENTPKGVYRYLPVEHKLLFMFQQDEMENKIDEITLDQPFVPNFATKAAVLFLWSTTPYRSEWKYDITAHKKILIDIGHVCQNLYLASESIGAGTCAIGIYDQASVDQLLGLDGDEEFVVYLAAVGKKQ